MGNLCGLMLGIGGGDVVKSNSSSDRVSHQSTSRFGLTEGIGAVLVDAAGVDYLVLFDSIVL